MSTKKDKNEAGNIDWEKLESLDKNQKRKREKEDGFDEEAIAEEKKKLSKKEKELPYPDDFLADVNLLNKSIGNYRPLNETSNPSEKDKIGDESPKNE